jgi:hypothetical protein
MLRDHKINTSHIYTCLTVDRHTSPAVRKGKKREKLTSVVGPFTMTTTCRCGPAANGSRSTVPAGGGSERYMKWMWSHWSFHFNFFFSFLYLLMWLLLYLGIFFFFRKDTLASFLYLLMWLLLYLGISFCEGFVGIHLSVLVYLFFPSLEELGN